VILTFRSERTRQQIGQDPIGQFAPGSELTWNRILLVIILSGMSLAVMITVVLNYFFSI